MKEAKSLIRATLAILIGLTLFPSSPKEGTKEQPGKCNTETQSGWVQCRAKVLDSISSGMTYKISMLTQSGETLTIYNRRPLSPTSEYQNWNLKKQGEHIEEIELASSQPKEAHLLCARGQDESSARYISPFSRYTNTASYAEGVRPLRYLEKGMVTINSNGLVIETRARTEFEENDCSSIDF